MPFTAAERAFLADIRLARVATTSSTFVPDVAPVTFEVDGDTLVVRGMDLPRTRKYHNVRSTGTASLVADDLVSIDPWRARGVKVTGPAAVEGEGRSSLIRIVPETIWSWGVNQGAETVFGPIEKRPASAPLGDS